MSHNCITSKGNGALYRVTDAVKLSFIRMSFSLFFFFPFGARSVYASKTALELTIPLPLSPGWQIYRREPPYLASNTPLKVCIMLSSIFPEHKGLADL